MSDGEVSVPPDGDARILAWGDYDGTEVAFEFPVVEEGIGEFDSSTLRWYLDYTEANGSEEVVVHLEGDFQWLP